MGIVSLITDVPGQIGDQPRRPKLITTDNLATITAAGYLNEINLQGQSIHSTDVFDCFYSWSSASSPGTYAQFIVSITNGVISLVEWTNPGNVLLPVTNNHIAVFNGTTGQIKDGGEIAGTAAAKAASDNTKATVASVSGATTIGHVASFADITGTIQDGGVLGTAAAKAASDNTKATLASVSGTITSGHVASFADTSGTVQDGGVLGNAAAKAVSDNTKATVASVSAATVSGNLSKFSDTSGTVADQGVAMKSVAQAVVAGGAAAQTVTDAFCTTAACVIASWNDTTNAVSIEKVAAGNGTFVVTSSGDPGASHLNYVIFK